MTMMGIYFQASLLLVFELDNKDTRLKEVVTEKKLAFAYIVRLLKGSPDKTLNHLVVNASAMVILKIQL